MDDIVIEEKYKMLLRKKRVNRQLIIEKNCDLEMIRSDQIKHNQTTSLACCSLVGLWRRVSSHPHSSQFTENIKTIQLNNFLDQIKLSLRNKREDNRSNVAPPLFFSSFFLLVRHKLLRELPSAHQHRSMQNKKDLTLCKIEKKKIENTKNYKMSPKCTFLEKNKQDLQKII